MNIASQRLYNQGLVQRSFQNPREVVGWMGAVQAQEYLLANWALGLRLRGWKETDVEQAFNNGQILRTHVMRPTWHYVTPGDIRWILELTAPRVHALNAYMYRKLELDEDTLRRGCEVIRETLKGGKHLTREEIGETLEQADIPRGNGMRLGYIVHYAELEVVICSGARRGKQHTYALIDERAPGAKSLPREEALAKLTKLYFTSHGPATVHDFAWWSGLTVADVKAGLELCKEHLTSEVIDGKTYWFGASMPIFDREIPDAFLLPPYDEYGVSYRDHGDVLDPAYLAQARTPIFNGSLLVGLRIVGNWRRTLRKNTVIVDYVTYRPLNIEEQKAIERAAQLFGAFLNMDAEVVHP